MLLTLKTTAATVNPIDFFIYIPNSYFRFWPVADGRASIACCYAEKSRGVSLEAAPDPLQTLVFELIDKLIEAFALANVAFVTFQLVYAMTDRVVLTSVSDLVSFYDRG